MKNSFRLKSQENFLSINRSPTNRSTSKQTFAFCKSPRFANIKPVCPHYSYNGQTPKGTKDGTSIGYDLTCSPGSSKYHLNTNFEQNKNKLKGCTMGTSRDKIKFRQYINRQLLRTPSINKYQTEKINLKLSSPRYSMRTRTKVLQKSKTIQSQNDNPGPADYQNPQSTQFKSRYSSRFPTISYQISRSKRFLNPDNRVPGAGAYKQISQLSNSGRYALSRFQGGTMAKMGNSKRKTKFDEVIDHSRKIPGVGSYRTPSQFGQYDGDIYQKFTTIQVPSHHPAIKSKR